MNKKLENKKLKSFLDLFSSKSLSKYYAAIEKPENLKKIKICFVIITYILIGSSFFIPKPHAIESLEKIPSFYSAFGFLACIGIFIISKTINHLLLMREKGYHAK